MTECEAWGGGVTECEVWGGGVTECEAWGGGGRRQWQLHTTMQAYQIQVTTFEAIVKL